MSNRPGGASVVIPNYNYARFLGEAVESALGQSLPPFEVIVVDDGSTDDSRAVIASFGPRVRSVLKENGGQASAINAGCVEAHGEVVFLLDPDDLLEPDAIETVLGSWPDGAVMTQYRLRLVDAGGRSLRGTVPAHWFALDSGDLRGKLAATGEFSVTLTSGLALRRDALLRTLPIPHHFRSGADGYLVRALAFEGPVHAIDRPLACYRRHGTNDTYVSGSPERMGTIFRTKIQFRQNELAVVKALARRDGLEVREDLWEAAPDYLLTRLCSIIADPEHHPVPGDSRAPLLKRVIGSQWHTPRKATSRLATVTVASASALLPRPLGCRLLAWWLNPATRPPFVAHLLGAAHGPSTSLTPRSPRPPARRRGGDAA